MVSREDYHYSITCATDDLAVLHALRGLSQHAEKSQKKMFAWSGTGESEWQEQGKQITFHFSDPSFREEFVNQATRLLPHESWREVGQNNNDLPPLNV